LSKIPTTPYTTRVQLAVLPDLAVHFHKRFRKYEDFQVTGEAITDGACLPAAVRISRPDILLLDLLLPNLDAAAVLKQVAKSRFPAYVVVIAPRYHPYLAHAEGSQVVRGTLLYELATSPLLIPVLRGIAEGYAYFTPEASLDSVFSDLTSEETILLALMAVGKQTCDLVRELDCTIHVIYTAQSRLRRKLEAETNEQAILTGIRRKLVAMLTEPDDQATRESA